MTVEHTDDGSWCGAFDCSECFPPPRQTFDPKDLDDEIAWTERSFEDYIGRT